MAEQQLRAELDWGWIQVSEPVDPVADLDYIVSAVQQVKRYGCRCRAVRCRDNPGKIVLQRAPANSEVDCRCNQCSAEWTSSHGRLACPKCGETSRLATRPRRGD